MYLIVLAIVVAFAGCQIDAESPPVIPPPVPRCICISKIYEPVCGTNNRTYFDRCRLECARRITKFLEFACVGKCPCRCICPAVYAPVCGSDGKTYGNRCQLFCAQRFYNINRDLKVSCLGKCPCLATI